MECPNLSATIAEQERVVGHSRTVVVGDFNMNLSRTVSSVLAVFMRL